MALTDRSIKAAKPSSTHQFIADANGLYLRVHPTGTKSFVYRSRKGGKARWTAIGTYPEMQLAEARRQAAALSGAVLPDRMLLRDVSAQWIAHIGKTVKTVEQVAHRMSLHILPVFGHRSIASITALEVTRHLSSLATRSPVMANRALADVKLMFKYAVATGIVAASPLTHVTASVVGGKEVPKSRVLSDEELAELIGVLRSKRFAAKTNAALALMLLTGQRSGEVRGIEEGEVGKTLWSIPAHRTKNGTACSVPYTHLLKLILNYTFKQWGSSPFEGLVNQVTGRAMRVLPFNPRATPHDLRRTMATRMADLGVAPHVIEKCLNHTLGGVMAIYNRSEYMDEKKAAYRLWHRHLLRLAKRCPRKPRGLDGG